MIGFNIPFAEFPFMRTISTMASSLAGGYFIREGAMG